MADAAAARREARRRRILENSQSRLQLISGKVNDNCCLDSPRRTPIPDPNYEIPVVTDVEPVISCFLNNGVLNNEQEPFELLSTSETVSVDREVTNDLAAFLSPSSESILSPNPSFVDKLITYKYDIVLVSLLMQLLYALSIISIDSTYIFLPLILYVAAKLYIFPQQNNFSIANALLLLNGISAEKVKVIMYFVQLFMLISRDACVFLFVTICIQSLCITVRESLIT